MANRLLTLLEPADAARLLKLTPVSVVLHARAGRLKVAATTPRGVRLFRLADVQCFGRRRDKARRRRAAQAASKVR